MSDKVGVVLSLLAFIIITVIVVNNYNFEADEAQFGIGDYYVAGTPADRANSEKQLLAQMNGARNVACPQTTMEKTADGLYRIGSYKVDPDGVLWRNEYFFLSNKVMKNTAGNALITPVDSNWEGSGSGVQKSFVENSGIERDIAFSMNPTIHDLFPFINDTVEIISPFTFTFDNINTNSRHEITIGGNSVYCEQIVIISKDGKCRITFDNVANWFCAGPIDSQGEVISQEYDEATESYKPVRKTWEQHSSKDTVHYSVIGNSGNAVVTGGGPGLVIGYAKPDTIVKFEYNNGGSWQDMSLHDWMTGFNNN